jgi:hypothetical protein
VTGRVEYSDNLSLRVDKNPGWHFALSPALAFSRNTESNEITGTASIGLNSYTDSSANANTDGTFGLNAVQRFERSQLGLGASFTRQTTAQGQLGLNVINLGADYVDRWSVSPFYSYSLTEQLSARLGASYGENRYSGTQFSGTDKEENKNVTAGLTYALSPQASAGISVSAYRFNASPSISKSDSWSVNANGSYQFSERTSLTASAGVQRTKTEQTQNVLVCPVDPFFCEIGLFAPIVVAFQGKSASTNYPFSLSYSWAKSEREAVTITASNSVGQFGTGTTSVSTTAAAGYMLAVTERLDFALSANWQQQRTLGRTNLQDSFYVSPSLSYRLSDRWSLGAGYVHNRVGYRQEGQTVEANTVFATLGYNWPLFRVAR